MSTFSFEDGGSVGVNQRVSITPPQQITMSGGSCDAHIVHADSSPDDAAFNHQKDVRHPSMVTIPQISSPNPFSIDAVFNGVMMNSEPQQTEETQDNRQQNQEMQRLNESQVLNLEEVRICNEIIEKLKVENSELEMQVITQQQEMSQLSMKIKQMNKANIEVTNDQQSEILRLNQNLADLEEHRHEVENARAETVQISRLEKDEMESMIKRLQEDVKIKMLEIKQQSKSLTEGGQVINNLQESVKQLKKQLVESNEQRKRDPSRDQFVHQANAYEQLKQQHDVLTQNFRDMQSLVKTKELEIQQIEKNSHDMLRQAQTDAEECIKYFKGLAIQNQVKVNTAHDKTVRERSTSPQSIMSPIHRPVMPQSLAPLAQPNLADQRANRFSNKKSTHSNDAHRRTRTQSPHEGGLAALRRPFADFGDNNSAFKREFTFQSTMGHEQSFNLTQPVEEVYEAPLTHHGFQVRIQACLESLGAAFNEIAETKAGIQSFVASYRDTYCQQIQGFSVLAYDYLEKVDKFAKREQNIEKKIKEQQDQVAKLKEFTMDQTKHIRGQSDLILKYRQQLRNNEELHHKIVLKKDKEHKGLEKFMKDELPLLNDTLISSSEGVLQLHQHKQSKEAELDELESVHDLVKKKVKILEEELEKSLQKNQENDEKIYQERQKYHQISDLIKDIWVTELQVGNITSASDNQTASGSDNVPMPINWLADLQEHIRQLKDTNDYQKDECNQILNMLGTQSYSNLSKSGVYSYQPEYDPNEDEAETSSDDGGISERNRGERTPEMREEHLSDESDNADLNRTETVSGHHREMSFSHRIEDGSHTDVTETSMDQGKVVLKNRKLTHNMTHNTNLGKRPNSSLTQRQPANKNKNSISQNAFTGLGPNQMEEHPLATFQPNSTENTGVHPSGRYMFSNTQELLNSTVGKDQSKAQLFYCMKEEIRKLKSSCTAGKETIVQMKQQLKRKQCHIDEAVDQCEKIQLDKEQLEEACQNMESDMKDQENQIEELQAIIEDREISMENLKQQIDEFEKELLTLQDQMTHIMKLNAEISNASEHWERSYHDQKEEFARDREAAIEQVKKIEDAHQEKLNKVKSRLTEREDLIVESRKLLEREKEHRAQVELKKQSMRDTASMTEPTMELLEKENEEMQDQLKQVKKDIAAVLDQYDKEQDLSRQLSKKVEKQREQQKTLLKDISVLKQEKKAIAQKLADENSQLCDALKNEQDYFKEQIAQADDVNANLQSEVGVVTNLTEELQQQVAEAQSINAELKEQLEERDGVIDNLNREKTELEQKHDKLRKQRRERDAKSHSNPRSMKTQQTPVQPHCQFNPCGGTFQTHKTNVTGPTYYHQNCACPQHSSTDERSECQFVTVNPMQNGKENINFQGQSITTSHTASILESTEEDQRETFRGNDNSQIAGLSAISHSRPQQDRVSVSPSNMFNNMTGQNLNYSAISGHCAGHPNSTMAQSCYCNQHMVKPRSPSALGLSDLKIKADQVTYARKKVRRVSKYFEELLKFYQNGYGGDKGEKIMNENSVIEARAYFQKRNPNLLKTLMNFVKVHTKLEPVTVMSSRCNEKEEENAPTEDSQANTYRDSAKNETFVQTEPLQHTAKSTVFSGTAGFFNNQDKLHSRMLFQKLVQTGRSLAGICFGGCIFMGQNANLDQRKDVDYALQFLAQDTTELEATTNDKNLEEIWRVIDSLLTCLSQIISGSCQILLQVNQPQLDQKQQQEVFESIAEMSNHLSMDQNHMLQGGLSAGQGLTGGMSAYETQSFRVDQQNQQILSQASSAIKDKLLECENRLKSKFQHISRLETSLDGLIKRSLATEKKQLDPNNLLKLIQQVRRVISKLKIELHSDYLLIGQVNVQFNSCRDSISGSTVDIGAAGNISSPTFLGTKNLNSTPSQKMYKQLIGGFTSGQETTPKGNPGLQKTQRSSSSNNFNKNAFSLLSARSGANMATSPSGALPSRHKSPTAEPMILSNKKRSNSGGHVSPQQYRYGGTQIDRILNELQGLTFEGQTLTQETVPDQQRQSTIMHMI